MNAKVRPAVEEEPDPIRVALYHAREVPQQSVVMFARLWQLETWLRQMVYVELRASFGNSWQQQIAPSSPHSRTSDARLTHMPTPELSPISYISFGTLQKTITKNWTLFEPYLPPQSLWDSKLEEVSQIRNRIAHFRRGHRDDLDRVLRFMRDIDQGIWKFCTSYNDGSPVVPPTRDPVTKRFNHLDQFPFVKVGRREWAMVGVADPNAIFSVSIRVLRRPWNNKSGGPIAGQSGYLYNVVITGRDRRSFDYPRYLQDTERTHGNLVHMCLESFSGSIRITIPAVLGTRVVNKTIQALIDRVPNSLYRHERDDKSVENDQIAEEWPEYILGPGNPLCYLAPDMPCSFFGV